MTRFGRQKASRALHLHPECQALLSHTPPRHQDGGSLSLSAMTELQDERRTDTRPGGEPPGFDNIEKRPDPA